MVTELRFPSSGWKFYVQGISLSALGIGFVVVGLFIVAVDPWNWVGFISMAGGVLCAALGVVLVLFVWFLYIYGTISNYRDWRQFGPPTAVLDATGIRYEAARRPAVVTWADVEQVRVNRTVFPKKNVTKVSLRLLPGAAAVREGAVHVPDSRYLNVGLLSETSVPEDAAIRFLAEIAGSRLEIWETDRRPQAAGTSRR